MIPARISGCTRTFLPPKGTECASIHVRDIDHGGDKWMVSAWYPSKEELQALSDGGAIYLGIMGSVHPVVYIVAQNNPL